MSFSYTPISKQQAEDARFSLIKPGNYHAVVRQMTPKPSDKGNQMIVVMLNVYHGNNEIEQIFDYLTFVPSMMWKIIHFCESIGLLEAYENGSFKPDMALNRNTFVKVGFQSGKEIPFDKLNGKPVGSKYPDRNSIEDYVRKELVTELPEKKKEFDDDIPF